MVFHFVHRICIENVNPTCECLSQIIHRFRSGDQGGHKPQYINGSTDTSARAATDKFAAWTVIFSYMKNCTFFCS